MATTYSPYPPQVETNAVTTSKKVIEHTIMEPHITGDDMYYVEQTVKGHLHRCDECGLLWEKRWHAATCRSRNHETTFAQSYAYKPEGYETHGKVAYHTYTRYAVGRDRAFSKARETERETAQA